MSRGGFGATLNRRKTADPDKPSMWPRHAKVKAADVDTWTPPFGDPRWIPPATEQPLRRGQLQLALAYWDTLPDNPTEAQFRRGVIKVVRALRLLFFETPDARLCPPGWPDLLIVGPGGLLLVELKTTTGYVRAAQLLWRRAFAPLVAMSGGLIRYEIRRPADYGPDGPLAHDLAAVATPRAA
jgi:hypothetical protein